MHKLLQIENLRSTPMTLAHESDLDSASTETDFAAEDAIII